MKKLLSFVLVLCILAGTFLSSVPANAVTYGYVRGDADDSTDLSTKDVLLVRKFLAGLASAKDINLLAADADEDEDTTTKDVLYIRKILAGLIDEDGNNTDDRYKIDTITIDGKNIGRYTIVIPDDGNQCMETSAGELRHYINKACGVNLNISNDESSVETFKIKYLFDSEDIYDLGKEGYRVSVEENGDLLLHCGSMRGPLYATFFVLEEIVGYRFLFGRNLDRSHMEPFIYESENINIPAGYEETEVPVLSYRAAAQGGSTEFNFPMLRLNAVDGGGSKSSADLRYGGGVGTLFIHAHSYEYQCGIAWNQQPCLTSEETYEMIYNYNVDLLNQRYSWGQYLGIHYTQISCSPNDNTNFCKCSACVAVYKQEGSVAGTVFRLSNRMAEALDKVYPGIEIFTIAYWDARNPPLVTRPAENVCVCFCIGGCNNHPYDNPELCAECGGNPRLDVVDYEGNTQPQSNVLDTGYFEKWTELTNNIYVWYYSANFCYYIAPSPNLFNVYNDFKYLAAYGATGIYSEGSSHPYYNFEYLRGYMASKMMWNPFMSEEEYNAHFNEFLMIYYGAGWEYVREYIEMSDHAADLNGCWTNNFDRPWNMYNEEYFCENYHTMRQLLDSAYEAETDPEKKERVRLAAFHMNFLGLSATYESDYVNGDEAAKALYKERYLELYDLIMEYNDRKPTDDEDEDYLEDIQLRLTTFGDPFAYCENFPKSRDSICNPMEWLFEDCTGYWEWDGTKWQ